MGVAGVPHLFDDMVEAPKATGLSPENRGQWDVTVQMGWRVRVHLTVCLAAGIRCSKAIGFAVHMADKLSPSEHLPDETLHTIETSVGCNRIPNELMRRQPIEIEHLRDIGVKEILGVPAHRILVGPKQFHARFESKLP